jgi:hypothetical protein
LTLEWWRGRRQPYTTPLRLYLVTSLLFFLGWERTPFAAFIRGMVSGALDAGGLTAADRGRVYAMFVEWLPATMIILAVPLAAALWYIANRAQGLFAGNLVLALHMHSAWFLAFAAYALLDAGVASASPLGWLLFPVLMVFLCISALLAERRVLGIGWLPAIVRSVTVGIVYLAILSMLFGLAFTLTANVALPR